MHLEEATGTRRRRGAVLDEALLDATWSELAEHGYGALTLDSVAQRAGTSRPVISRRWSSKQELVRAAVAHVWLRDTLVAPDLGSLRDDMVALLQQMNAKRIGIFALLTSYLGGYFQETGTTPAELRESVIGDRPSVLDAVVERAAARRELRTDPLTPRMRTLAFDLYRHEALMRLDRVPDDVIVEIVDEIYLPLVLGPGRPGTRPAPPVG